MVKLLVVDDDAGVLASCQRIFETHKIKALYAKTVPRAVKILEKTRDIDLLLTDIMMPDTGGYDLIQWAQIHIPALPILMMSGYLVPKAIEQGMERGAQGWIAKPFTPDELLQALGATLEYN